MEFNKIYKRTALPYLTFCNQLEKDLREMCEDLSLSFHSEKTLDKESSLWDSFPISTEMEYWRCYIYLDVEKQYCVSIDKTSTGFSSGYEVNFKTPREIFKVGNTGGGNVNKNHFSYSVFKTQYGFGFSLFDQVDINTPPPTSYNLTTYFFKMKDLESNKEYFCCYSNPKWQSPPGIEGSSFFPVEGYLLKPFNEGIEPISKIQFSYTGGGSTSSLYGVNNIFANMYSFQDGSYAEHCYIKLCTEEGLLGHFTMGGKEFISGSWLALEC